MNPKGDTQTNANSNETPTKIKSEKKILKLQEDEYTLEMSLYDNNDIEFKVSLNSPMADCYYVEQYNLEKIKEISFIFGQKIKDMECVYQHYKDKILPKKEINLMLSQDKNIMSLKYEKIFNEESVEVVLELKKNICKNDDIVQALMKEVEQLKKECNKIKELENKIDELKKNNDFLMEEFNKIKEKEKEEEKRKIEEEEEKQKRKIKEEEEEKKRKTEELELSSFNDNVNYINNFKFENFQNLKKTDEISINKIDSNNVVAVYCIIKNNERLYQMAYIEKFYDGSSYWLSNIVLYNLVLNKVENKIYRLYQIKNKTLF